MLGLGGFFLLVLGCRWAFVDAHAVDLPVADQWDAIGETLLRPAAEGRLHWTAFFAPHNEHRPALTRLLEFALIRANHQWDARLETAVNALFPALLYTLLLAAGWHRVSGRWRLGWLGLLALLGALPYGAENALHGFQSQFYFLALGTVGYLWLTLEARRFDPGWWLGQLCAVLSLFTIAAAAANGPAVAAVLVLRHARGERLRPLAVVNFILALAYLALSLLLWHNTPENAPFRAAGVIEWATVLSQVLAWPLPGLWPWALALAAPVVVLLCRNRRRRQWREGDSAHVALFLWVVLQGAAIAYARAHDSMWMANRYVDLLALALPVQFLALLGLIRPVGETEPSPARRRRLAPWALAWLLMVAAGLVAETRRVTRDYTTPYDVSRAEQIRCTRAYLISGDPAVFRESEPDAIPYPRLDILRTRLATPAISAVLPASVRPALALRADPDARSFSGDLPATLRGTPREPWFSSHGIAGHTPRTAWFPAPAGPPSPAMLRLWVAGDLGSPQPGLHLALCNADARRAIRPTSAPGTRWKRLNVPRPEGAWWIEAEDTISAGWFAFTAPVELGRWSWLADKILWAGPALACVGGLLLLVAEIVGACHGARARHAAS